MSGRPVVPLLVEASRPGRVGCDIPGSDVPSAPLGDGLLRADLPLPELSQLEVVRHFTDLSYLNYAIDTTFFPLGSCTMKYNPRVNELVARLPGFADLHPLQDDADRQGVLRVMHDLQTYLATIAGLDAVSLAPAAGAQGELAGILIARAYHESRGEGEQRRRVVIPDSAHGTNPATAAMAGYSVTEVPSDRDGNVDVEKLAELLGPDVAAFMLTLPNTLGLFERRIEEIVRLVHDCGALLYLDGANMNALLGRVTPGALGFDIMHFNLHKTFSTPHGGGGPGAGPVAVRAMLADFLPGPIVTATPLVHTSSPPSPLAERGLGGEVSGRGGSGGAAHARGALGGIPLDISISPQGERSRPVGMRGGDGAQETGAVTEGAGALALVAPPRSIGRLSGFYGNFGVMLRAYTFMRALGGEGLSEIGEAAVINANYLLARLRDAYDAPFNRYCMHEALLSGRRQKRHGVRTLDIAKRLLDHGYYAPTVYFPLVVEEAMLIEPTESEAKEAIDEFCEAMLAIAREAETDPDAVKAAPTSTPVRRLDEATAARHPVLRWQAE